MGIFSYEPLRPQPEDTPEVRRRKTAAESQLDSLLDDLTRILGFSKEKKKRVWLLKCKHGGKFKTQVGRTLADQPSWGSALARIRAEHQRACGRET